MSRSMKAIPLVLSLSLALPALLAAESPAQPSHLAPITVVGDHFEREGRPYQILSGAIHYARVPREYWRDRLQKARAMGLNTIETYVFWNLHEPEPGHFDFSGQLDVAAFVRIAQEEGLNVILRPGPYACAEWDGGGYPAWLFADPSLKVRSRDPRFMAASERYLMRLGKELSGLQTAHGGPIIAVQIENEYGSYGKDKSYEEAIHQILIRAGLGDSLFYTADGVDMMPNSILPGILAVANFAPGEAKSEFAKLAKLRPGQPLMSGEYWDGWFDAWGDRQHAQTDTDKQVAEIDWMLQQGYSFNLYMFHGGTSFGFMNGANLQTNPDDHYSPQTTSYDYDAALDEAGRPTRKFFLLRDAITRHTGITPPPMPLPMPISAMPDFHLTETASLWKTLPKAVESENPRSMESLGQSYGYILYRTRLSTPGMATLYLERMHDYAAVYLNQKLAGYVDRRLRQDSLQIQVPEAGATLDILVENTGRVNYGPHLVEGSAGIPERVLLDGRPLTGWQIVSLPMSSPQSISGWEKGTAVSGPAFHRGTLQVDNPVDTYLDTSALGKGFVWVNGHNLGRVWSIGPQKSLYLPGAWLHRGSNEVVVFDLTDQHDPVLRGLSEPLWSQPSAH